MNTVDLEMLARVRCMVESGQSIQVAMGNVHADSHPSTDGGPCDQCGAVAELLLCAAYGSGDRTVVFADEHGATVAGGLAHTGGVVALGMIDRAAERHEWLVPKAVDRATPILSDHGMTALQALDDLGFFERQPTEAA